MPWYEYLSNAYIIDFIGLLWTDYSMILGIAAGTIGAVVKKTKTKADDEIWAFVKERAKAAIGKGSK